MDRRQFLKAGATAGLMGWTGCVADKAGHATGGPDSAADAQQAQIGATQPADPNAWYLRTTDPEAQWFPRARLGLFIHWGISSVHGGIDLSWGMIKDTPWDRDGIRVTPNEYWTLAERFSPDKWDPAKVLAAAKSFGCRYAVLTTRHHDGFAMWPSDFGDFGTRAHLGGRDFVRPFVEACRAEGLKVGLYYSPPNWHYARRHMSFRYSRAEGSKLDANHEPTTLQAETPEYIAEYQRRVRGQVEELLTRYGRIDLMWFDGVIPGAREAIPVEWVRRLQPHIVCNPRLWGAGDFDTPECQVPTERPAGWWEICHMWHIDGWGYNRKERYRPTATVLDWLALAAAWGGNLLINVSPGPDGTLPQVAYDRMAEASAWIKVNGPAVFESEPGPYPEQSNVPVTTAGKRWYLLVPPEHDKPIVLGNVRPPVATTLMGSGRAVTSRFAGGTLTLDLPAGARSGLVDVIAVDWS
ncbi:MAG TPA: alpha-L-fucosidase [Phycisphaerae bacterium]|nr:alpha-L-fucosidase [Phycisphaerae bacterium]